MTSRDASTSALLVGLANPRTMPRLLDLAARIHAATTCAVVATHVVTVREQIALRSARSSPEVLAGRQLLQDALDCAADLGISARAVVEVGREIHEGLLNAARTNEADLVLVGYSPEEGSMDTSRGFDRVMHRVARGVDADLVVARFQTETAKNLLVPLKPDPNLRLIAVLLRALGTGDDTTVRFLHVAGTEETDAEERAARYLADAGLTDAGTVDVVRSDDVIDTIVAQAAGHDMVLLEDSPHPSLADDVLGSRAERIAERVSATALLVRARPRG